MQNTPKLLKKGMQLVRYVNVSPAGS